MGNSIKSLRHAIWGDKEIKPQDIGESLRDLWNAFRGQTPVTTLVRENLVWAPPFLINHNGPPAAVLLGRAKIAQQPQFATSGFVQWTYTTQSQISVANVTGLTVGTAYDLAFVIIG
jgi:hypothetical protein